MKNSILLNDRDDNTLIEVIRKGRKILTLVVFMLLFSLGAKANSVDAERARRVATTFLNNNGVRSIELADVTSVVGFSNVYVFTTETSFVLISADDCVQPILGYSLTGRFDFENMPDNKRAWIQGYSDEIRYAVDNQFRGSSEVAQQWHDYAEGNTNIGRVVTAVTPLIQTQWNQDWPYNNLCPDGTVTGCAATAMAQVLKYWNYPPTGIGMHSYGWNGQTVSADFGSTTYDWDNMLNTYDDNSTETQQTAVATLMFHCGVALDMNYGWAWSGGSSAYSSTTAGAFINYFNYSTETQLFSRSYYSDTEWINMVKAELNQSHPIWYCGNGAGGGHAFVCDGYNNQNYFHFNWGWGGYCDEYYTLDILSPGPGGIGSGSVGDYSNNQQALFGAQPSPESSADAPVLTASLITGPGVRNAQLNWNQVENAVSYNVYRNGTLVYSTDSESETSYLDIHIPYGTTTYYVRCIDENGVFSWPSNYAPVSINFPAPTNVTAVLVEGDVQLSWTPCEGAVAYNVYCNNGVLANGINQTYFYDDRPIAGELNYFIKGVDSFGDESESSDNVLVIVPYSTPIVNDLEAAVSGNTVALSWSAPDWCFPETPSAMLNYGSDIFNGYFGYTFGSTFWGHRYPAANLVAYSNMSIYKASFYARIPGDYEMLVYEGTIDGHPQTLVRQQTVWIDSEGWHDIVLPEKVQIDASLDYWVFFHDVNGIYCPVTYCNYSGNEGNYYSRNPSSGVSTYSGIACLIHTYLTDGIYTYNLYRNGSQVASNVIGTTYSDNALVAGEYNYYVKTNYYAGETEASNQVTVQIGSGTYYTISASANPPEGGSVTGAGSYLQGNSCTLTATANTGYTFVNWTQNGDEISTNATLSFTVTENATFVANFNANTPPSQELEVFAEYYPNSNDPNSQYVKVYWSEGSKVDSFDQYIMCIDDITLSSSKSARSMYRVYRAHCDGSEEEMIANNVTGNQYIDYGWSGLASGNYRYGVSVINERGDAGEIHWNDAPITINHHKLDVSAFLNRVPSNNHSSESSLVNSRDGWLYYDDGTYVTSVGAGGSLYWGTMFPASMLTDNRLTKVALFLSYENNGTIILNVYSGGDAAPETLIYSHNITSVGNNDFYEITFSDPVTINPNQNLWITFYQSGDSYPASACNDSGDANNRWVSIDGSSWYDLADAGLPGYGWMIRCYVEDNGGSGSTEISWSNCIEKPNSTITQTSTFSQGYNWWCSYIEQSDIDGLGMLQEGLGNNGVSIRSQASGYTDYYQGYGWYGSLSSINNESSYRVITSAPCTVTITGNKAIPSEHPITLSQGWTWIGYVPTTAMDVNVAMAGLTSTAGDKLKSQQGYADYYPNYGWFGSLNTIEPGMGLMYYSMNGNPVTFTYPNNDRGGELKKNLTAENNHWEPNPHAYPTNMTLLAVIDLDGEEIQSENYELAVFDADGECRGSIKTMYVDITGRYYAFMTIYGDSPVELHFGLYDWEAHAECFNVDETVMFNADASIGTIFEPMVLHFHGLNNVDEFDRQIRVFPNPVNCGERFSLGMAEDVTNPVRVEIINALGVETLRATSVQTPAQLTAPTTAGVYTLRITVEGKATIIRKLIVK